MDVRRGGNDTGEQAPSPPLSRLTTDRDAGQTHGIQVSIDWVRCNGLGICVALAPQAFLFDHDEEVATVLDPEVISRTALLEVARACPREAIFLDDADGRPLYP